MENPFRFDDGSPRFPTVRPKDAACLILVRKKHGSIRLLMGERDRRHAFLPGRVVFPGGGVEPADQRLVVPTDLRPEVLAKVAAGTTPLRARGLALAAIRETFEETGILVGRAATAPPKTRSEAWTSFLSYGVVPQLENLDFVARAITPPGRPRRFDARFFMTGCEQIAHTLDVSRASGELLKPLWLTLTEARAAKVIPITRCIIDEIEARLGDDAGLGRPVPFFIPHRGKAVIKPL
jgi:8-oxo-dGTP pyrophosphatase MutT (NUDIX family)